MTEQNFDDDDFQSVVDRDDGDGPGTDDLDSLPEEDFDSFAEGDIETEAVQ